MQQIESILIVDDNRVHWPVWCEALEKQGYPVFHADDKTAVKQLFSEVDFGLVLLRMNNHSGKEHFSLLEWIKLNHPKTDVIMITSYATLTASIEALRRGAYDYLVAPVNIVEVVSRVDRCMSERRECAERLEVISQIELKLNELKQQLLPEEHHRLGHDQIFETKDIILDRRKQLVVQDGEPIQLSPTEFDMLEYLVSNADRVVSSSELIRAVQGYDMDEEDARPIVRVNVRRLRQKIEAEPSNPQHIITVRSRGYRFAG